MHSRFDDSQTELFLARLNPPLRWMPRAARMELHAELRQHLDALAAAHEELGSTPEEAFDLALRQFGDPAKIGRKLWWEWFWSSRPCVSKECQAALHALLVYVAFDLLLFLPPLLLGDGHTFPPGLRAAIQTFIQNNSSGFFAMLLSRTLDIVLLSLLTTGIPLLAGFTAGRKFPGRAIKAARWIALAPMVWILPALALAVTPLGQNGLLDICFGIGIAAVFGGLGAFWGGARTQKLTGKTRQAVG